MYFYGSFQNDVLITFFIPLRRAEAITRENFVPAIQKRDPALPNETFYGISEFHPGQSGSCNHHLT